jgi:dipeptidyl aminopeptidase/acylaminoacyl peptidase
MTPGAIGDLIDLSDVRLSPDGGRVAFVVTTIDIEANEYRSRIWLAATDGSSAPRPFSAGTGRDSRPRWSPDGATLAFVSHRDEKGCEIYVIPVSAGGEVVKVAGWPEEVDELAWSPDGRKLAFGARQRDEAHYGKEREKDRPPRRVERLRYRLDSVGWTCDRVRQLFLVPADGASRPVALTSGEWPVAGFDWHPAGDRLVFASGRHDTWDRDIATDLWIIDARPASEPRRLTVTGSTYSQPVFHASGDRIACLLTADPTNQPRHAQVAVLRVDDSMVEVRTASLDRQCAPSGVPERPLWVGDDIYFRVEDSGNIPLYRIGPDDGAKAELVVGGDRQVVAFDAAAGVIAIVSATATGLPEVSIVSGGVERRLTDFGVAFDDKYEIATPERFLATSADGTEVEAWIMRPIGAAQGRRYPLLLNVHGGPFLQYGNRLFDEFQIQAAAGYAVAYSNPRGSSGYTEAWGRAIRGPKAAVDPGSGWGGCDYQDVMAVVDEAIARFDFVDADRLGVLGGSYGGFMASWIIGHTDRFTAAVSERAVNNRLTSSWTSDFGLFFGHGYLGVTHLEDPEEYLRVSPITYVNDVHTPVLILHSENDLRCPIEQAEELFVALKLLGREVEFVRFPGEGHEMSRSGSPKHRVMRAEIILDWFARKL